MFKNCCEFGFFAAVLFLFSDPSLWYLVFVVSSCSICYYVASFIGTKYNTSYGLYSWLKPGYIIFSGIINFLCLQLVLIKIRFPSYAIYFTLWIIELLLVPKVWFLLNALIDFYFQPRSEMQLLYDKDHYQGIYYAIYVFFMVMDTASIVLIVIDLEHYKFIKIILLFYGGKSFFVIAGSAIMEDNFCQKVEKLFDLCVCSKTDSDILEESV
jgi:hypothetical protein